MNIFLKTTERFLLSLSRDELEGISNALNEICNGVHINDAEFQTRIGTSRSFLQKILLTINSHPNTISEQTYNTTEVWADGGSVQVRAISSFGDPVDMSAEEARDFAALISDAAKKADNA